MESSNAPTAIGTIGARRNEDIALDLFRFIADRTELGKGTSGVGFQQAESTKAQLDRADKLLELYGRCLGAVGGKK